MNKCIGLKWIFPGYVQLLENEEIFVKMLNRNLKTEKTTSKLELTYDFFRTGHFK